MKQALEPPRGAGLRLTNKRLFVHMKGARLRPLRPLPALPPRPACLQPKGVSDEARVQPGVCGFACG